MFIRYQRRDVLFGLVVYAGGDTIATLILGAFNPYRMLGMMLVGATVYAYEIPNYCERIQVCSDQISGTFRRSLARTGMALLYFNPLWIARHLLFIALLTASYNEIGWGLLRLGALSFAVNIPISLLANFMIQNTVPLRWRFFSSAVFSSAMAVYYALSRTIFGG